MKKSGSAISEDGAGRKLSQFDVKFKYVLPKKEDSGGQIHS